LRKVGAIVIKSSNQLPYYYNNSKWVQLSINAGSGYVLYSDSNTVYVPKYGVDTARLTINTELSQRVKYTDSNTVYVTPTTLSDTASSIRGDFPTMDSTLFATNYRLDTTRYNLYAAILNSTFDTTYIYQALSDTANNIRSDLSDSLNLKVYLSDSNIIYVTPTELADTASAIRGAIPSLTGYMLKSDSTIYAPLYRLDTTRTALDSRIDLRVKYTDTSTMLTPYLRKVDTASLSSRINLKVNISDTSTMLTPYLRKVDTTAMLTPYL